MKRLFSLSLVAVLAACGGGEPATDAPAETETEAEAEPAATGASSAPAAPTGEMTMPSWFEMDEASQTVTINLVAGANSTANYWNYHGATNGNLAITVPEGYTVNMTLQIRTWRTAPGSRRRSVGTARLRSRTRSSTAR